MNSFEQITDVEGEVFKAALQIYSDAFPARERHPVETIKARIVAGKNQLFVGPSVSDISLMALLFPLEKTDFILLDYLATKPADRGKGLASTFLQEVFESTARRNKYLVFEVEDPRFGDNQEERTKRVSFFKRNGAKALEAVKYVLPPLQGKKATEMILLISPNYDRESMSGESVKKLIIGIYKEVYSREADDSLLNVFLAEVPNSVNVG